MADRTPAPRSDPGRGDRIGAIDDLLRVVDELHVRLGSSDTADAESAPVGLTAGELEGAEIDVNAREIESLVALGILGRLVSGGESRLVWMPGETESNASARLAALAKVAEDLRDVMASARALADDIETIDGLVEPEVDARQVEALIALGLLGRIISGGSSSLVWTGRLVPELQRSAPAAGVDVDKACAESEEFQLDVAADYQHERLLMYRVIVAFETVAAIVLIREIVLRLR